MKPCKVCGRTFVPESLMKHEPVCRKTAQKKPKVFDSSKQRVTEDLSLKQIKQNQRKRVAPPKSDWKAKHVEFIQNIRAAKGAQIAIERGDPLPPPPPPAANLDYITCPYCSRRFNEKASERHIDFCREQSKKIVGKREPKADEKARAAARTKAIRPKHVLNNMIGSYNNNTQRQFQVPKPKTRQPAGNVGSPSYSSPETGPVGPRAGYGGRSTGPPSGNRPQASKSDMTRTPNSTGSFGSAGGRGQPGASRGRAGASNVQPRANDYADFDNAHGDYESPAVRHGSGLRLRTGRDLSAYKEAKMEVKGHNSMARTKASPMRDVTRGNLTPPSKPSSGMSSYSCTKESESGYYSSSSEPESAHIAKYSSPSLGKFCHECGSKYPTGTARFCCECGMKRKNSSVR